MNKLGVLVEPKILELLMNIHNCDSLKRSGEKIEVIVLCLHDDTFTPLGIRGINGVVGIFVM